MTLFFNLFFILFTIFIAKNWFGKLKKKHPNEPKGPIPLPIVGNLFQMGTSPHTALDKYTKECNGVVRIWMFDRYLLFISNLEVAKEIYSNHFPEFNARPMMPNIKLGCDNQKGVGGNFGATWTFNRGVLVKSMRKFNSKQSNRTTAIFQEKTTELCKTMKYFQKTGQPMVLEDHLNYYVWSVMAKYIFSEDLEPLENGVIEHPKIPPFTKAMDDVLKIFTAGQLLDFIEPIESMYYKYLVSTNKEHPIIRKLARQKYDEHIATHDPENPRDLLDCFINEFEGDLSQKNIVTICQLCFDINLGGIDTTVNTLEWAMLELINHPDQQEIVFNELKEALKTRGAEGEAITLADRINSPYIQAVIKEVLRLHPSLVFGVPRENRFDDIEISTSNGGYFIPKKSVIFLNFHAIAYDESLYPDPSKFNPARFLENNSGVFIPFGIGTRQCPAQAFAYDNLYLSLANILLNFKLKSVDGKKINDQEVFGVKITPVKYNVSLESR